MNTSFNRLHQHCSRPVCTRVHTGPSRHPRGADKSLRKVDELFFQLGKRLRKDNLPRLEEYLQLLDELYLTYWSLVGGDGDELLSLEHLMTQRLQDPFFKTIPLDPDLDG